ncbi:MAG: hypothetical protein BWX54_02449 [Verrucomicrobia bacterium ADurb.Bin018]|nr:MAG: hypothetical protein BWX70_03537 [Verrucomicrobia bacterium ADurb.Bin070]OQC53120.1 MAG: hypothetical protein BWX54_02449 [Verrucomicrobia bacterium ADurb.Bin018]
MATAFEARRLHPIRRHARHHVGVEGVAVAGEEQRRRARVQAEPRTHFLEIAFEPGDGARADGHDAVFLPFAAPDGERAPLGVEVGEFEAAEFGAAQAATVKEFEHRAIAHAERIGDVGHGEQRLDLAESQRRRGQALFHARQFQLAGRIVEDDVLFGEPAEEVLEHAQARALRAPAQALAVGLGAAPEGALIRFEDGARDVRGVFQVAFRRPRQKDFQSVAAAFERAFGVVAGAQLVEVGVAPEGERVGGAAVKAIRLRVVAAALRFRATGEPFDGFDAFGCGHDYVAKLRLRGR